MMKNISIEFVNIQSHEHTKFSLRPGLNFILAEDNNVGKSTIFKVLLCAMQLPKVSGSDIDELIRGGCTQARATFRYERVECTLWLFRGQGQASRAFFETDHGDGVPTRGLSAPASLRDAFDIVSTEDGSVVNFNDADSVQLIVQDTPKNDEVLSKVLIDLKVDAIKANAVKLGQQIQQDYRVVKSKLDDVTTVLSTMQYVEAVDSFKQDKTLLSAACRVADSICDPCSKLEVAGPLPDMLGIKSVRAALRIYEGLYDLTIPDSSLLNAATPELFDNLGHCLDMLKCLDVASGCAEPGVLQVKQQHIDNAKRALDVLLSLTRASNSLSVALVAARDMDRLASERARVHAKLKEIAPCVVCPVKGEVYYSDEKCVSCGDRSPL